LASADDEIDLSVSRLEHTVGVAPFRQWWWSPFFSIVVVAVVAVLATSVITSVISAIIALVVMEVVAAIITSIPVVIATVGPAITILTSIRSTVTVVKALVTVPVIVVAALDLLRGRQDPKGTLQLLTLPHGMPSVAVELALVVHNHVKVTFEEGGRSWWICHVGFARSLARPVPSVIVVFAVEVVHHHALSVD
jgi:hypothetical protein